MKWILTCFLCACMFLARAQSITSGEFFFDSDPGVGNGQIVAPAASGTTADFSFNASTNSLSQGFHTIGFRSQNASGQWSHYETRVFYINHSASATVTNIAAAEFFIDTDPGVGLGTPVSVGTSGSTVNFSLGVPTAALSSGFHTLILRTKTLSGQWSHYETKSFYIVPNAAANVASISAAEFFLDSDPGVGLGTPLSVATAGNTVNLVGSVPTTNLSPGFHNLAIRTRDADGKWSHYETRAFYISTSTTNVADLQAAEFFIDNDPGVGSGNSMGVNFTGNEVNLTASITSNGLTQGFHTLNIRSRDANGKWGMYESRAFYVTKPTTDLPNITAAEFFLDTDPGVGNATPLSVTTPGTTVNQGFICNIPANTVNSDHMLFIRVRDAQGDWSHWDSVLINVVQVSLSITNAPADTTPCKGDSMFVRFDAVGFVGSSQDLFTAQLSDANGDFTNAVTIGSKDITLPNASFNDSIFVGIPINTPNGSGYRIRIVSSAPPFIGSPNDVDISIQKPAVPTISANGPIAFCDGDSVTLTSSAATGNLWSNGATTQSIKVKAAGPFTVAASNANGCFSDASSATVVLVNSKPPVPTISANGATTFCETDSVLLTSSSAADNTWSTGATTQSITVKTAGSFTVTVTNGNACSNTSVPLVTTTVAAQTFFRDADNDGFGNPNDSIRACTAPPGFVSDNTDCDDNSSVVHAKFPFFVDNDGDGFGVGSAQLVCAIDANTPPSGFANNNTDCDDNSSVAHAQFSFFVDNDGDGFGVGTAQLVCAIDANTPPSGFANNNTDCDDNNSTVHAQFTFFIDNDGDGFGVGTSQLVCAVDANTPPSGFANNNTDCDDNNSTVHAQFSFFTDNDGDGFGIGTSQLVCAVNATTPPSGFANNNTDCDDNNSTIHQQFSFFVDNDGDGFGTGSPQLVCAIDANTPPSGFAIAGGDCNDNNNQVNPGAVEICGNGIDDNCNGVIDEGGVSIDSVTASRNPVCVGATTNLIAHGVSSGSVNWFSGANGTGTLLGTGDTLRNMGAGTYFARAISSCGAPAELSITVQQVANTLSSSFTKNNIQCFGNGAGSLTVAASGGIVPFSFRNGPNGTPQSSPTFSGLRAGNYRIFYQDAAGCSAFTGLITITQPSQITFSESHSPVSCVGSLNGSINVSASGGSPSYQFSIGTNGVPQATGNFTGLRPDNYRIFIKDNNGCSVFTSVITIAPSAIVSVVSKTDATCVTTPDGSFTVTPSGGVPPFKFKLSPAAPFQTTGIFNGLMPGNYRVYIEDNIGCNAFTDVITVGPVISSTFTKTDPSCNGRADGTISVTATGGVPSFQFRNGNGPLQSSGNFNGLKAGVYRIFIKDARNCTWFTDLITLNQPSNTCPPFTKMSIVGNDYHETFEVQLSPNPTASQFVLKVNSLSNLPVAVKVMDISGKVLYQTRGSAGQSYRFGEQLNSGAYMIEVKQGNSSSIVKGVKIK